MIKNAKNRQERKRLESELKLKIGGEADTTEVAAWGTQLAPILRKKKESVSGKDMVYNPLLNSLVEKFRFEKALVPDNRNANVSDRHKWS